jgi:hypothetical protein
MVRAFRGVAVVLSVGAAAALGAGGGCGGAHGSSDFGSGPGGGSNGATGGGSGSGDDGSAASSGGSGPLNLPGSSSGAAPSCPTGGTGWNCKVDTTCGSSPTTLTGKVYDPAGANPLFNIAVFVPNDPTTLPPITLGTHTCNTCDVPIGNYVTATQTDTSGSFTLKGVPTGKGVPITIQAGKWRRTIPIDITKSCATNTVQGNALSLPSKHSQGDMPQMALLTGGFDNLGCFLYKMGIDPSEYSAPHGGGRLDIYEGVNAPLGVMIGNGPGLSNGQTAGDCHSGNSCPLWASKSSLEAYDMVLLACEGDTWTQTKPASSITAMHDWLNEGGKVFATHFHYLWFQSGPADFQGTATWKGVSTGFGMGNYDLDTSFAKGQLFQQWLSNVGVTSAASGTIALNGVADSVGAVNTTPPQATVRWIYDPASPNDTKYLSFGTPIGGSSTSSETTSYCGKAVFSDLHAGGAPAGDVPGACTGGALTDQEKALEFLFFDLSACVQNDMKPVQMLPPPQ